jgi:hypothetical protein
MLGPVCVLSQDTAMFEIGNVYITSFENSVVMLTAVRFYNGSWFSVRL